MNPLSIEAVLADERYETGRADRGGADAAIGPAYERECLRPPRPPRPPRPAPLCSQRNDHPAARGQLLDERRRDLRATRRHEDGVVGSICAPSQRAIA